MCLNALQAPMRLFRQSLTGGRNVEPLFGQEDSHKSDAFTMQRVLIVGESGVGAAAAHAFDARGATVAIVDCSKETLRALVYQLHRGHGIVGDFSSSEGISAALAAAAHWLGGIDILILNVRQNGSSKQGMDRSNRGRTRSSAGASEAALRHHLCSTYELVQAAQPHVVKSGGCIVDVVCLPARSDSMATPFRVERAAQEHLAHDLGQQLAPQGVRFNSVLLTALGASSAAAVRHMPKDASSAEAAFDAGLSPPVSSSAACQAERRSKDIRLKVSQAILFLSSPAASYLQGACLPVPANAPGCSVMMASAWNTWA